MDSYSTVKEMTESTLEVKKSVFITRLCPCASEEEAQEILGAFRKEHFRATHHCYAYVIGSDVPTMKFSDDGEPSGTAGRPILSCLEYSGLRNVLAVVIRYFGGIKLGASGLTRAYSTAVSECLKNAATVTMARCIPLTVSVDYGIYPKLESYVLSKGYPLVLRDFSGDVSFTAMIPAADMPRTRSDLTELSAGKCRLSEGEETLTELPEEICSNI